MIYFLIGLLYTDAFCFFPVLCLSSELSDFLNFISSLFLWRKIIIIIYFIFDLFKFDNCNIIIIVITVCAYEWKLNTNGDLIVAVRIKRTISYPKKQMFKDVFWNLKKKSIIMDCLDLGPKILMVCLFENQVVSVGFNIAWVFP